MLIAHDEITLCPRGQLVIHARCSTVVHMSMHGNVHSFAGYFGVKPRVFLFRSQLYCIFTITLEFDTINFA